MTSTPFFLVALRSALRPPLGRPRMRYRLAVGATLATFSLVAIFALVPPPPPSAAKVLDAYITAHAQKLAVSEDVAVAGVNRDRYSATAGVNTLVASGTNYDWARLVILAGGWPVNDTSVTVLVRWMRQENGADNWWNRNNPLNNGYGSGGGGGTGSYANLEIAAQKAAEMLHRNPGMSSIAAAFASAAPSTVIEQAIWASPWASSHYGNGSRWHYTPVAMVKAPAGAW
ncbi:MAG: hypothetical protein JWN09_1279 [Microbacteriaceae bacterium]|nr:hypothetical protein [Microbacteriaceae bacterium]